MPPPRRVAGPDASRAWISRSVEQTERAGERFAAALVAGDVVSLIGPLGAGKTRVVAGIARGLGWTGDVRSPTFTLVNEYRGRLALFHADLYRVDDEEVDGLGFEECLERGVLAVEWGEKLTSDLLDHALILELEAGPGSERTIAAHGHGARGAALAEAWARALRADDDPTQAARGDAREVPGP